MDKTEGDASDMRGAGNGPRASTRRGTPDDRESAARAQADAHVQLSFAIQATIAMALGQVATWLLNVSLYPSYDGFFSWARDINQTWSGLVSILLVIVAMHVPRVLAGRAPMLATFALLVGGYALAMRGSAMASPVLATIGTCALGLSGLLTSMYVGLMLVRLSSGACLGSLLASILVGYALMGMLWLAPTDVKFALLPIVRIVQLVIVTTLARPVLAQVSREDAPADLSITNPLSFLPATHRLFIAILLFEVAYGYMITFGSAHSYPRPVLFAAAFVLLAALYVLACRRLSADVFYGLAFVFVLGGLLVASTEGMGSSALAVGSVSLASLSNVLISAGNDMFRVAIMFVLAAIGRRNVAEAVPVLLLNAVASNFGIGAGALMGLANNWLISNSSPVAHALPLMGAYLFAAYNFFLARAFSFDQTVRDLLPMAPAPVPVHAGSQTMATNAGAPAATKPTDARVSTDDPHGRGIADGRLGRVPPSGQRTTADGLPAPEQGTTPDSITAACTAMAREYHLTPRETEVFDMLAHGRNVAYMQQALTLSRNTIKTHVANVYGKLDVHSHQQLIDMVERMVDMP